jgi:hypothetical protein
MVNSFVSKVLLATLVFYSVSENANAMGRKHSQPKPGQNQTNPAPKPAPNSTPSSIPAATPSNSGTPISGAESCHTSDPNHICIGVKVVSFVKNGKEVLNHDKAIALISRVSKVWTQCNIGFQLEDYRAADPTASGLSYEVDWYNDGDTVRSAYQDASRFLMVAAGKLTGSSNTTGVTWDAGTGDGFYGSLIDGAYAEDELTVAHEFGHYQGLYHVNDQANLLYPYAQDDNHVLTAKQCATARSANYEYWQQMLR